MAGRWLTKLSQAALSLLTTACQSQHQLHEADLLFHVTRQSNPITDVTPDMIDHVAIVLSRDSVIEAVPRRGVTLTPLDSLRRQEGYYIIGRVRRADATLSLLNARSLLGRRYDALYLPDNADIYCSELVEMSLTDSYGRRLFHPVPMSFHDASGRTTDYWTRFYRRHGMAVPEGRPGTNPAELSRRPQVRIIGRLR